MAIIQKNGTTYNLTDPVQIMAFKNNGWIDLDIAMSVVALRNYEAEQLQAKLSQMSEEELRNYAGEHNIDLGNVSRRETIIQRILQA